MRLCRLVLALELPAAVGQTAGNALDPAAAYAGGEHDDDMPAHPARRILERGGRMHDAAQSPVATVPDETRAVADLRERGVDGPERGDLIVVVQLIRMIGELWTRQAFWLILRPGAGAGLRRGPHLLSRRIAARRSGKQGKEQRRSNPGPEGET